MLIGSVLDEKYEILELIGQGGMAKVYKAKDLRLGRFVAVKILKNEFMENEQFLKKFLREAQADAKLTHPNIVNVYDVGVSDGYYYIVMEYIDGNTLKQFMKKNKNIDYHELINLLILISQGVSHAHENEIIHRDIKPHNILMTSSRIPKVADFGIARAISSSTVTATEEALGSVHYISPEQARGAFLDERSDLYSLGIMIYEMLTSVLPYDGETPVAVALKHVQNDVPSPKEIKQSIPDNLNQIVLNLTRRKADDRYQNAEALISDLKKIYLNPDAVVEPTYTESVDQLSGLNRKDSRKNAASKGNLRKQTFKERSSNKRFAAILLTVVVMLSVFGYFLATDVFAKRIIVPDVVGMTIEEASKELDILGLEYTVSKQFSDDYAKDAVISQLPDQGIKVKEDEIIELVVSLGPSTAEIPNVVGMNRDAAVSALEEAGFDVTNEVSEFNDEIESNIVIEQNPSGGTVVAIGEEISLVVSKGPEMVTIPSLKNKTVTQSIKLLNDAGLLVGDISYKPSSSYSKDIVLEQNPSEFSLVVKNTTVNLTVSLGPEVGDTFTFTVTNEGESKAKVNIQIVIEFLYKTDAVFNNDRWIDAGETESINTYIEGAGEFTYKIYVDNELYEEGRDSL